MLVEIDEKLNGKVQTRRKILRFPFYTYENESYSNMMIDLMNSLEVRFYKNGEILANELDECLELIFVEKGTYRVGYGVNNKIFYKK